MKKFLIAAFVCCSAMSASAVGLRSLDMTANVRHDFGVGIGVTMQLPLDFEFAPAMNYFFSDDNVLTIEGDFRYRFGLPRNFSIYPLAGIAYMHADPGHSVNKLGLNIGAGFSYDINSRWTAGAEMKYQYMDDDWDDAYFTAMISYSF